MAVRTEHMPNYAARPPREAPWRRAYGPEPLYTFDIEDAHSFVYDMCLWQLYHRPEPQEHNLKKVAMNAIHRYFEGIAYERRRRILETASRDANKAEEPFSETYYRALEDVERMERMVRRNIFIAAGGSYPMLNRARE